jgi:iron complex transport system ATP-binding protein
VTIGLKIRRANGSAWSWASPYDTTDSVSPYRQRAPLQLNNLDMKHAVGMMKLLRQAADALGKTIVLVLHDINFASCYSDYIVAMRDGAIVRHGTPGAIMTSDVIPEVYGMDVEVQDVQGRKISIYYI